MLGHRVDGNTVWLAGLIDVNQLVRTHEQGASHRSREGHNPKEVLGQVGHGEDGGGGFLLQV